MGKIPPMPEGRFTHRYDNYIAQIALNDCSEKDIYKYVDLIGGSPAVGCIDELSIYLT